MLSIKSMDNIASENISGHFGLLFLRAPYKFQFYFTLFYFNNNCDLVSGYYCLCDDFVHEGGRGMYSLVVNSVVLKITEVTYMQVYHRININKPNSVL